MVEREKVLLTGGGGMVGRNVLERINLDRWRIVAPTRRELNLLDYSAVLSRIRSERPDIVVHAAGRVGGIQANIADPVDFLIDNVDLARNVVLAAREAGVTKLLNIGSSCMYPRDAPNPLTEGLVLKGELEPTNEGYALAKIFAARLCQYVREERPQLNYKTLIPCNLYGRYDKFDPERSHLLPAIIHKIHLAAQNDAADVEIWGSGSARREFMYAGDLADAVLRAMDDIELLPGVMNVGLGYDNSINDYYAAVAEVVGWHGEFTHNLSRPVGMKQKLLDIGLQQAWGWQASTSLRDGIRMAYEFYLKEYAK